MLPPTSELTCITPVAAPPAVTYVTVAPVLSVVAVEGLDPRSAFVEGGNVFATGGVPSYFHAVPRNTPVHLVPARSANRSTFDRDYGAHDDTAIIIAFHLGTIKWALRATLFGGYDGSFDEDPESVVALFGGPLVRAVALVGQALAAAAPFCADAVGATGGGVLAVEPAQTTCSTICPANPMDALWEEELLRWNDDSADDPDD